MDQFTLFLQDLSILVAKHLAQQAAAPAAAAPAAAAPAAAAPAPAATTVMPLAEFRQEAIGLLQRHGNNQAPVTEVLAKFGLQRPDQLSDEQRAPFIAALRVAFGETA